MRRDFDVSTMPAMFRPEPLPVRPLVREAPLPEWEVQAVMKEMGFDFMQARNHVRCRQILRDRSR